MYHHLGRPHALSLSHLGSLLTHHSFWQLLPANPGGTLPELMLWLQEHSQPACRTGQSAGNSLPPEQPSTRTNRDWRITTSAPWPLGAHLWGAFHTVSQSPVGLTPTVVPGLRRLYRLPFHLCFTSRLHATVSWYHLLNTLPALDK